MEQPKKGWKVTIKNNDTGEEFDIDLDTMTYTMMNDLVDKHPKWGSLEHPGWASRGYNLDLSGYKANPDFIKEFNE